MATVLWTSRRRQPTYFSAFDHLSTRCRRTRGALLAVIHDEDRDGRGRRDLLAREALTHVDAVLEGLVLLARTGQFSGEELRALVRRAGIVAPPRPGTPKRGRRRRKRRTSGRRCAASTGGRCSPRATPASCSR